MAILNTNGSNMNAVSREEDANQRSQALDIRYSYIVQAPAGSGKTELLSQRFLSLLSHVINPEEVLAITFTKKAAAEMRARIIATLQKAQSEPEPTALHAKKSWQLARYALEQDKKYTWHLLKNPNRLRIQTIDSFNASLVKHLPILSRFGAPPEITNHPQILYQEAVDEFLAHLEEDVAWSDAIATLLIHLDNDKNKVQTLLVNMLGKRDQWLPYIMLEEDSLFLRKQLEHSLALIVTDTLKKAHTLFPSNHYPELMELIQFAATNLLAADNKRSISACLDLATFPGSTNFDHPLWLGICDLLLTADGNWRKRVDKAIGFPAPSNSKDPNEKLLLTSMKERISLLISELVDNENLRYALIEITLLPNCKYQENQWHVLSALYLVLKICVAQLKVTFQKYGKIDYIENAQAALTALGTEDAPTDLALALDYQIRHILIDEFQDTSSSQFRLIEKLTTGWEPHDGRTLFIVGDPMQSIYRFREAEVGLFIRARSHGIGQVKLKPITLSVNFRSTPAIVNWLNKKFQHVLPTYDDIANGAVSYSPSIANNSNDEEGSEVKLHPFSEECPTGATQSIIGLIKSNQERYPNEKIAILVRSRTHLAEIIPALKNAGLCFRAIDIDPLRERMVVQDIISLTQGLLHLDDRVAWLALLRAPWCGLSLADLLILSGNPNALLWESLLNISLFNQLSTDGQKRLARITPILKSKLAERKRYSLRSWIESTWLLLGGPACLVQDSDLDDIAVFFNLLDTLDHGGDLPDIDRLHQEAAKLYAVPDPKATGNLQIMTIHNAKGLEFDTVILPALHSRPPNEEKQLLLWLEHPRENGQNILLLAPVHATGNEYDSVYQYIKRQHLSKLDYESGRLLYVAATRAKKRLHLFFDVKSTNFTADDKAQNNSK